MELLYEKKKKMTPENLGRHSLVSELRYTITCSVLGMGLGYAVVV